MAASRRSRAATWKTWPPEAEKLRNASLTGSTSGEARERDRGLPVGELLPDAQDPARLSTVLADSPVVEGKHAEPVGLDYWIGPASSLRVATEKRKSATESYFRASQAG
jgi:hypothetical protein